MSLPSWANDADKRNLYGRAVYLKAPETILSTYETCLGFYDQHCEDKKQTVAFEKMTSALSELLRIKGGTTVLLNEITNSPEINLDRYEEASVMRLEFNVDENRHQWKEWGEVCVMTGNGMPEIMSDSEPTMQNPTKEFALNCVQNVFNTKLIGKQVDFRNTDPTKISFLYKDIGLWTFRDTHKSAFDGTTQDCIMLLKDREATVCSVGLLIELVEQSQGMFPDAEHRMKIIRDLVRMHGKRSFQGSVFAVVTDLTRIVALSVTGSETRLLFSKTSIFSGKDVQNVMEYFVNASAQDLGIDEMFSEQHVLESVSSPGQNYTIYLDRLLGKGAQATVYRVASYKDVFVKAYAAEAAWSSEVKILRHLSRVEGVCNLLATKQTTMRYYILCTLVGRQLITMTLYGNVFVVYELGCVLLDILKDIHDRNIIHRDVSPFNIYVITDDNNYPKHVFLSDFGCAVASNTTCRYAGSYATAADSILRTLGRNRNAEICCDRSTDLESFVKTLWMLLSVECKNVTDVNKEQSRFDLALVAWRNIEEHGMYHNVLNKLLEHSRRSEYTEIKALLCLRGHDVDKTEEEAESETQSHLQKPNLLDKVRSTVSAIFKKSTPAASPSSRVEPLKYSPAFIRKAKAEDVPQSEAQLFGVTKRQFKNNPLVSEERDMASVDEDIDERN